MLIKSIPYDATYYLLVRAGKLYGELKPAGYSTGIEIAALVLSTASYGKVFNSFCESEFFKECQAVAITQVVQILGTDSQEPSFTNLVK